MIKKIKNEMGEDKEMKLGQWAEQQALTVLEEQGYVCLLYTSDAADE